jgi:hypothetical protein
MTHTLTLWDSLGGKESGPSQRIYLHNTQLRQTSCPAGFEPEIPPSDRLKTDALSRAFTGIGGFDSENLKAQTDIFAILLLKSTNPL